MAKQSPSLYSVAKTFIWFAITSLVLTGCLVAMVLMDHNREWKVWQKKFISLKIQKAQGDLKAAAQGVDAKKLGELEKSLEDAKKTAKTSGAEREKTLKESEKLNSRILKVRAEYQTLKQYQDSYKYYLEETRLHKDPEAVKYESKLKELSPRVAALKTSLEGLEKEKDALDQKAAAHLEAQKAVQK